MRYIGYFLLYLAPWMSHAAEPEVLGSMSCDVKHSSIIEIKDGVSSVFNGYNDRFEVGDTLDFGYKFISEQGRFSASLTDEIRNQTQMSFAFSVSNMTSYREDLSLAIFKNSAGAMTFGTNYLRFLFMGNELTLNRYYKNDWNGIARQQEPDRVHIYTLDCKSNFDNIDTIVGLLKETQ